MGKFADWQGNGQVFAFVTKKANVDLEKKEIVNIRKSTSGFTTDPFYHYANSPTRLSPMSPKEFFDYFEGIYAGSRGFLRPIP